MEQIIRVKGYHRSCLYDLNREDYTLVPNEIDDLIRQIEGIENLDFIHDEVSKEWIQLFLEKEFLFKVPKNLFDCFVELNSEWEYPGELVTAVVEYSEEYSIDHTIGILDQVKLKYLVLCVDKIDFIDGIVSEFIQNYSFTKIDFVVAESVNEDIKEDLLNKFPNIGDILTRDAVFVKSTLRHIGSINTAFFFEARKFHTYFNRRLYIDHSGNILNSFESEEVISNISNIGSGADLVNLLLEEKSQQYWNASKDLTDICNVCEFRYMCYENRIPLQRKNGSFYHKQECDYNPYICKWKNEAGYKTLAQCGIVSNESGLSVNHQKIEEIYAEIWRDE